MRKNLLILLLALLAIPFAARADELTIAGEGQTTTNSFVPFYGTWVDAYQKCEFVIPEAYLEDMQGSNITSLKWYLNSPASTSWANAVFKVFMKIVDNESISAYTGYDDATVVYEGAFAAPDGMISLEFSDVFRYDSGNLLIGIYETTTGTYSSASFDGVSLTGASISGYNSTSIDNVSANQRNFLPKTTFTYEAATVEDYAASVNPKPENGLAFGSLAVGDSKTMNVTVRNTGTNAFTPSVTVAGNGFSTDFTAAEIASKGFATIPVTFTPTKSGDFTGTLTINCGQAGTFELPLTGSATLKATVADGGATNPYLPVYGYNYDGAQTTQMIYPASMLSELAGKKLKSITFYFTCSSGSSGKTIFYGGNVAFSLANTTVEAFTSTDRITEGLTPVASVVPQNGTENEWTITFDEGFTYEGQNLLLSVETSAGTWANTTFSGESGHTGAAITSEQSSVLDFLPKVTFEYELLDGVVTTSPTSWDFGQLFTDDEPATKEFTVNNNTDAEITLALTGLENTPFSAEASAETVAAREVATVTVTYTPTAEAGEHSATLTIVDGVTVALTGETLEHVINGTVTPSELNLSCYEEQTATADITIENTGNTAFTPVFADIEAPFSIADAEEIAAGESKTFTVTYTPEALGEHTGTLTVTIGEQDGIVVGLTGSCTKAPLELLVADGTNTETKLPITGNYLDTEGTYGQTIYAAEMLSILADKDITKVKYFSHDEFEASKIAGTVLEIYMMETDEDEMPIPEGSYSQQPLTFEGEAIGEYEIVGGETELEFTLSTPFHYSGTKNLAIQVMVKTKSPQTGTNYQSFAWYGMNKSNNISYYYYSSSGKGAKNFMPKTLFSYNDEPVVEPTTLAEILETNPVGTEVTVSNDLAIAEIVVDQNLVFVSDGEDNWIELQVSDDVLNFIATTPTLAGSSVKGQFVYDGFNPSIVVEEIPAAAQEQLTVEPAVYPVNLDFAPKPCEVFFVTGYYHGAGGTDNMPNLREWSGNGGQMGVLLDLDLSWARGSMEEGKHYKIRGTALLKEAWEAPSANGIRPRMATDDPMALRNYTIMATAIPSATTGIETIAGGEVKSVRYYNAQGLESAVPFQGINIVVMEMNDGTKKTVKVVK